MAVYLIEVVVMKKRCVVLQFSLLGLLYLILPFLFQFCYTLKATQEMIRHRISLPLFCVLRSVCLFIYRYSFLLERLEILISYL